MILQTRSRLLAPIAASVFLAINGLLAVALPLRLAWLSTLCIVLAEAVSIAGCLLMTRRTGYPVLLLWRSLAASTAIHMAGMSLDLWAAFTGRDTVQAPAAQTMLSTFYVLPLLLAASMQFSRRTSELTQRSLRLERPLNVALSLAAGVMFSVLVFSVVSTKGTGQVEDLYFLTHFFLALDAFVALAMTIRAFGTTGPREAAFFNIAAIFLWVDAILPGIHNYILIRHDYVWLDLLITAPYLVLAVLIAEEWRRPVRRARRSPNAVRLVRSASPIFLSLGLVLLGLVVSRRHFYVGSGAILLAVVCYGAMSILSQSRSLEIEESLMIGKRALEELVDIDGLTQISNRRAFDERIALEHRSARRRLQPLSLLMIDVDYFKQLNDHAGHLAGDQYLYRLAQALRRALPRAGDFVSRYGGEEFAALLPATDQEGAAAVALRLHRAVAELHLPHPGSPLGTITISIGHATFQPPSGDEPAGLIQTADAALYRAKREGRNRTAAAPVEAAPIGKSA
ncbi:diguanylate cyclase (GGDEF) domain-containing protein [Granulicella rosea]|uniref:diguanylate cyclase n=1 Tax=Granulicella rosea TaxID=474952 RepID=A0A239MC94_9BACT|nr:diguanylate cyclase [Granulicella rosea]SNT40627.1 diguanylate cyclase (GGDEF) domain-containing protein [Granulicella rosea]